MGRTLHPNPNRTIDRLLATCPKCETVFPAASQTPQQAYERVELPAVRPDVVHIRLFGGRCACCGERVTARPPAGLEQGSPFGHSIAAMVVYLHYAHAIGMERLALLMDKLFSLSIGVGAICNILARARQGQCEQQCIVVGAFAREVVFRQPDILEAQRFGDADLFDLLVDARRIFFGRW